ncbi:thiol-disulfide oxidoreductase DCC family protein [Alteribacter natronophilus]|uniref:thiol-disulfide oxidoreductase DCC family protein n=1 Tax=Alteribacter natronophilus TaxID=2583810 RepID=UPI00110D7C51|nr:thiol-disulfide oxidoreductase DCC family protein [Alteribacter natronophilus]TMW71562.1 thiol-disulfide oxidoreductase DCC family protein [Alteribacter natronophilus]
MSKVVLFDGECNFCDRSVQFIIKRDPDAVFRFASLQSEAGQRLLKEHGVPESTDSMVLIDKGKYYLRSAAALRIARHLRGLWKLVYVFIIVPPPVRNAVYSLIARNRIRWFGKKQSCALPSPDVRKRFL